jgi:hypothetical protein
MCATARGRETGGVPDERRVAVELADECFQPAWVPDVVIASPAEVVEEPESLGRNLEDAAPVIDETKHVGVLLVHESRIQLRAPWTISDESSVEQSSTQIRMKSSYDRTRSDSSALTKFPRC